MGLRKILSGVIDRTFSQEEEVQSGQSEGTTRREALERSAIGAATIRALGVAGLGVLSLGDTPSPKKLYMPLIVGNEVDESEARRAYLEERTQRLIESIEINMSQLEERVSPLILENIEDEKMKKTLLALFKLVRRNWLKNPHQRNKITYDNYIRENGVKIEDAQSPYFYYSFGNINTDIGLAAFGHRERTIHLAEDFDPNNILQLLDLLHELLHLKMDDDERRAFKTQDDIKAYVKWVDEIVQTGVNRVIIEEEELAHAVQIETLNLLVEGSIKQAVLGGKVLNLSEQVEELGIMQRPDAGMEDVVEAFAPGVNRGHILDFYAIAKKISIETGGGQNFIDMARLFDLLDLSQFYFEEPRFPGRFRDKLMNLYGRQHGNAIYTQEASGKRVRIM